LRVDVDILSMRFSAGHLRIRLGCAFSGFEIRFRQRAPEVGTRFIAFGWIRDREAAAVP
jgi:hypothetical protein